MGRNTYTAILEKEDDLFVALCPELDVASQGATVEEATAASWKRTALPECGIRGSHIVMQRRGDQTVTVPVPDHSEIKIGTLLSIIRQSGIPRAEFEE